MAISFDSALAGHAQALAVATRRAELIASNLANADTPDYKARDIDFRQALDNARPGASLQLAQTQPGHMASAGAQNGAGTVEYRVPAEASLDGNTVDTQMEQTSFAQNALRYQATLTFMNAQIRNVREAIKGQ